VVEQVEDILPIGKLGGLRNGFSIAAGIVTDDPVLPAEKAELTIPHGMVGYTRVDKQDGFT
jgi:hypothetical protein